MSEEIRFNSVGVAPAVLDTIVTLAVRDVEGVASVGSSGLAGLVQKGVSKGTDRAVDVTQAEPEKVAATVHIQVVYGTRIKDVGAAVQYAVADAIRSQVGVDVERVDVYVDGVVFAG